MGLATIALLAAWVEPSQASVGTSVKAPSTHRHGSVCIVSGSISQSFGATPPTVSTDPVGVVIVWLPGLNSKSCKAVTTRGGPDIARDLARAIDKAPEVTSPRGRMCPSDDNTTARLFFSYHGKPTQQAYANLTGCEWINAPGDAPRWSTARFRSDIAMLAPAAWRPYVSFKS
jgi:hypothetical protein